MVATKKSSPLKRLAFSRSVLQAWFLRGIEKAAVAEMVAPSPFSFA
jgi:hypothetical protein